MQHINDILQNCTHVFRHLIVHCPQQLCFSASAVLGALSLIPGHISSIVLSEVFILTLLVFLYQCPLSSDSAILNFGILILFFYLKLSAILLAILRLKNGSYFFLYILFSQKACARSNTICSVVYHFPPHPLSLF